MDRQGAAVIVVAFVGAFCGIVAGAGPDVVPGEVKLFAGATAAGCAAMLALLRPPGMPRPPAPPPADPDLSSLPPRTEGTRR